ncbi:hypothetical protein Q0N71_30880, partial [Bacillus thuringiensis]
GDGIGSLAEGEIAIWKTQIDGKWHYFQGDGAAWAANSWLGDYHQEGHPNTWYIVEDGEMVAGWREIEGTTYYFDPENENRMVRGWFRVGDDWYRTNSDGRLNRGTLSWNGTEKYFFDKETGKSLFSIRDGYGYDSNGNLITGQVQGPDGENYYFTSEGKVSVFE